MKKITKILVALLLGVSLVSCGSVSQSYADKINAAAATSSKDDDYTYDKVMGDLGKNPISNAAGTIGSLGATGAVTWAKGCKSQKDVDDKLSSGKDVDYIIVTFANGKATSAVFGTWKGSKK